jgi:hypothetical protein
VDVEQGGRAAPPQRQVAVPAARASARDATAPDAVRRLAKGVGNRALARMAVGLRDGEGILPDGVVHPDVEAAIARAGAGGRPLDRAVAGRLEEGFGQPLADVRVHTDEHAAALSRAVSARAFTVGNHMFFGAGEYRPDTAPGAELIAHEAAHVVQQRGAPAAGPLTVSEPGDALEREAEAAARGLGH